VADARVVLGAAAPVPWRASAVEAALVGCAATPEAIVPAARAAVAEWAAGCLPLPSSSYKVTIARALIVRALENAVREP